MQLQMWSVVKSLSGLVTRHQELIAALYKHNGELTAALASQFGWEPPVTQPEPTVDELEAVKRGVAELEEMFGSEPDKEQK
ncbi:hypothetical protein [Acidobacterium sp. S8]|uniref:hypothetical protein n=1 Tax=Acidobacterium sp. S8 TaxID=1641854 RepID=UPI00131E47C3|nr:hypothetical protein [Acidobacterium sp. S8]